MSVRHEATAARRIWKRSAMGRVTRSRSEALLTAPAPDGLDTLERWSDSVGGRLRYTEGARLVDAWLIPADERLVAFIDGPDEASFDSVVEQTAQALGVPRQVVELRTLVSLRDRWAFRGDPTVSDPARRDPRVVRWEWIDVAPDDRTLRVEFVHGVIDGLHHVEIYEDDEEVRVTVFLGLNHDFRGGAYALLGIGAWTTAKTNQPVGRRYINDGADSRRP
jgi:hypothetical protein